jgi:hypothetical protein
MRDLTRLKNTFNAESNPIFISLVKEITRNKLSRFHCFRSWRNYFIRYIDPEVIHRKKDIREFEKKFEAEFFEILYSLHLIIYLFGKKSIEHIIIPGSIESDLYEDIFEEALELLPAASRTHLIHSVEMELDRIREEIENEHIYTVLENIYMALSPRELRKPLGEYFTPLELADRMVGETGAEYSNGQWLDNSSGFGVFLLAFLRKFGLEKINSFICIETNPLSVFISKIAVIHEYKSQCDSIPSLPIYWGDSLLNEKYAYIPQEIKCVGDFSPFFGKIEVVIGNPPWVSWKSMTKEYQTLIGDDWRSYDIFEKNITRKTLGACNDDLSSYFVYYSIDKFLKNNGLIKLVINLSLFKSSLAGKQFRQFAIQKSNTPFRLLRIIDLSGYKVFQGITNSYCIFEAVKGQKTHYPIPYILLSGNGQNEIYMTETTARPVNNEAGGELMTLNGNEAHFKAIEGICEYKARAGVCTGLNSAYWIEIVSEDDLFTVINLGKSGRKKLKEVESGMEKDLVYKLLRARNLKDFDPIIENRIIIPQIHAALSKPIPEEIMRQEYHHAYHFFLNFKNELLARSGYKKFLITQPFYALYNIGPYTAAPIKLGWQFVSKNFQVYLIDNAADIIPDLNVMFIPLSEMEEAYYLHALLNSKYAREKIESSSNWTFPGGSIQKVHLEKYDGKKQLHSEISRLQKIILGESSNKYDEEMDSYFKEYWFNELH